MCMLVFKHIYGVDDVFSHKKGIEVKSMQASYEVKSIEPNLVVPKGTANIKFILSDHSSYQPFVKPDRQSE